MTDPMRPSGLPFVRLSPDTFWPATTALRRGIPIDPGPLRLAFQGRSPIGLAEPFGSFGGRRLPRGLAIGPEGRLFLADPDRGAILSALAFETVAGADPWRPLWSQRPDPRDPWHLAAPSDVALTKAGDLAIADPGSGKVLILAWPSASIRRVLRLPGWHPSALIADAQGWLYVADPILGRLHRFDRQGRRSPDWPHPAADFSAPRFLALAAPNPAGGCACGCAGTCRTDPHAAHLYVLDGGALRALNAAGAVVAAPAAAAAAPMLPAALIRDGARLLHPDPLQPGRDPLVIPGLPLTRDGRLAGTSLPVIALPRRIEVPRSGALIFDALDAQQRGFAWDRVTLDLVLPPAGSVILRSLTTEAALEPDGLAALPDADWSRPLTIAADTPPEVLIQSPPGRYLWLRLDLLSDGASSPLIRRIDVFGPRRSGLGHLPAVFHQDPESRDFLDRYLAYFDTVFAEARQAGRDTTRLFDPMAAPEGAWLAWLGAWFDLQFLAEWPDRTRREMIASAVDTASLRGTAAGVSRMLRWHLGLAEPWPTLIEHFRLGPHSPPVAHHMLPKAPAPHRLTVVLPRARVTPAQEPRLRRLVEGWLPAHVTADMIFVEPGLTIGCQSLLGVDTLLGARGPAPLGAARAGIDLATAKPFSEALFHIAQTIAQTIGGHHVSQGH